MNVLVFGTAGKTGKEVVSRALAAGHTVTVFVHEEGKEQQPAEVRVVSGDAADPEAVRRAMAGQDAVIDTIGGKTPFKVTDLESKAAANIIAAMRSEGAKRLVVISMMGMGETAGQTPFWYHHLVMPTFLRGAVKDKAEMENEVSSSGLEFVIARPPLLKEEPAKGSYVVNDTARQEMSITRGDLAQFLVDQVTDNRYVGQAVVVANAQGA